MRYFFLAQSVFFAQSDFRNFASHCMLQSSLSYGRFFSETEYSLPHTLQIFFISFLHHAQLRPSNCESAAGGRPRTFQA